jgi:hypothetical protein
LSNIFFEIFKPNPIAIKCTIPPKIMAIIKSSSINQLNKKATMEGIVIIEARMVPFDTISNILSLDFVVSDNMKILKNGNKNQRYFIFGEPKFRLLVKLQKNIFK